MNRYSDMTIWALREELSALKAELATRDTAPRAAEAGEEQRKLDWAKSVIEQDAEPDVIGTAAKTVLAALSSRPAIIEEATAWIATTPTGSVLHMSQHDGWKVEAVQSAPGEQNAAPDWFDLPSTQAMLEKGERDADALEKIKAWCNAYPLDVFPEPDFKEARRLLEAGGMTLAAVSASNMRHVLDGIRKIISLKDQDHE